MSRAEFSNRNKTLVIKNVTVEDEGSFTCFSVNRAGNDSSSVHVEVNGIYLFISLFYVFIHLFVYSFIYYFTKKSLLKNRLSKLLYTTSYTAL